MEPEGSLLCLQELKFQLSTMHTNNVMFLHLRSLSYLLFSFSFYTFTGRYNVQNHNY